MNAHKTNENENQFSARQDAAGWDPYEIWRTRVLLPRLEVADEAVPDDAVANQPRPSKAADAPVTSRDRNLAA
jgi:hypothetical protein